MLFFCKISYITVDMKENGIAGDSGIFCRNPGQPDYIHLERRYLYES